MHLRYVESLPPAGNGTDGSIYLPILKEFAKSQRVCAELILEGEARNSSFAGHLTKVAQAAGLPVRGSVREGRFYLVRTTK